MMGYEGRSLLLDDGEEWVNIPLVVREFMRQLNDEVHTSRSAMESLRQEQKEVNLLLRRVMQKQVDLDMDNTRNTLSLNRATQDATQTRHTEQIHYLRKKQEKLDEKLQLLSSKVSAPLERESTIPAGLSNRELADKIGAVSVRLDKCDQELREQAKVSKGTKCSTEQQVTSSVATAIAEVSSDFGNQVGGMAQRLADAERNVDALKEALELQQQESKRLRDLCVELSNVGEADRQSNKERLTACLQMVEKVETLCTVQRSGVEADLDRLKGLVEANAGKGRDEAKSFFVELRDLVKGVQHDAEVRCAEIAEEVLVVRQQQDRLQAKLASVDGESDALRALKATKQLAQRIADLETDAESHLSTFLPRREYSKSKQEVQSALELSDASHKEAKALLETQIQQLGQRVKAMQTEHGEDNDWLHNELGRLGTVISYGTQQRERQERQVTSLCDIVHNLSIAVEALQAEKTKRMSDAVGSQTLAATAGVSSPNTTPVSAPPVVEVEPVNSTAAITPSWEIWRSQVVKEIDVKLSTASALQQRFERLSQQLNELTAKVDGGARYAQTMVAQQMDHVRQNVKDEVSQQLQAHAVMRDLTPALVVVEAVKRRVAGLELEVQSVSNRAERRRAESTTEFFDTAAASSDTLRRLTLAEDGMDALRHRIANSEQHHSSITLAVHQLDTRVHEQERVTAKFGTDLTAALEKVLHTEESLSRYREVSASQMTEMRTLIDHWRAEMTALAETQAACAAQSPTLADMVTSVGSLSSDVTRLSSALDRISGQVAAELERHLHSVQNDLDALRQDCAAAADKNAAETARCTREVMEAMAKEKEAIAVVHDEVRQRQSHSEADLRAVTDRLTEVEAAPARQPLASPPETSVKVPVPIVTAPLPLEPKAVPARMAEELRDCHRRLDAQQQRMSALDDHLLSTIAEQEEAVRREWKGKMDALRDEMVSWATSHVAAQVKRCRGELRSAVEEAVRAAQSRNDQILSSAVASDSDADATELHKLVGDVKRTCESRIAQMVAQHRRELDDVVRQIENAHMSHAELRREVCDTVAAQQEEYAAVVQELRDALDEVKEAKATANRGEASFSGRSSSLDRPDLHSSTITKAEEERGKEWRDDVLRTVHAEYYSKSLLEERLENIWSSMISLLSRKEDVTAVNEKLSGLHQLMQEELQIETEKLEEQLAGQLAEKVSLAGLQDILEDHFMEPRAPG